MEQPVLAFAALACAIAAGVWGRSARYRLRVLRQVSDGADDDDLEAIARSDYRKDLHTTVLYGILAVTCIVDAFAHTTAALLFTMVVAIPAIASMLLGRNFVQQARLEQNRTELERRAQEVL